MTSTRDETDGAAKRALGAPIGPGSLVWEHFGDSRGLLLAGRGGVLQNMMSQVSTALHDHSDFFEDPWNRIFRSLPPIQGVIYDPVDWDTGVTVRDLHTGIKGVDAGGQRYHALDPDVFWWTHATFVESIVAGGEYFGTPLTHAQKDQLVRESITWWSRYGLSLRPVATTWAEFDAYWNHMLDNVLERNATTDFAFSLDDGAIPPIPGVPAPVWRIIGKPVMRLALWIGRGTLPPRARQILGLTWSAREERALRAFGAVVRTVWPLLPHRVRYLERARAGMRRVSSGTVARRPRRARPWSPGSP